MDDEVHNILNPNPVHFSQLSQQKFYGEDVLM